MTIEQAMDHIDYQVCYRAHPNANVEYGFISSVGSKHIFVRYITHYRDGLIKLSGPQATYPEDLELVR